MLSGAFHPCVMLSGAKRSRNISPKPIITPAFCQPLRWYPGFLHASYFSVVTMTALGFGDIAANPDSWQGQVLLMVQVSLGYMLLGALVTRFAVLFTAGGPPGRYSESEPEVTE